MAIYPVKSIAKIACSSLEIQDHGIPYDRKWMLIDEQGNFITQREQSKLNELKGKLIDNQFYFYHPDRVLDGFFIKSEFYLGKEINVKIWSDTVKSKLTNPLASEWLSNYLNITCAIVETIPENRYKNVIGVKKAIPLLYTDAYPIHIINQASVDNLSLKCGKSLDAYQFRPNIIVENLEEYREDEIRSFEINHIRFKIIKPCERCIISTLRPDQSRFQKEPLKSLAKYRKHGNAVWFGMYAIKSPEMESASPNQFISVSDTFRILE
ncbi:MAG: MOSC domain-containing protein [Bacteroidota bacterium]|nr:MOSC domain-containing protein [Bacteroidota bacterium]